MGQYKPKFKVPRVLSESVERAPTILKMVTLTKRAAVAWLFAACTAAIKIALADTTDVVWVLYIPYCETYEWDNQRG